MKPERRILYAVIFLVLLLMLASFSFAQTTNDPRFNENANACFEGGTLYGLCNITDADRDGDVDQKDIDWMWTCGWYFIRADYGIIQYYEIPLIGCDLPQHIIPLPKENEPIVRKRAELE